MMRVIAVFVLFAVASIVGYATVAQQTTQRHFVSGDVRPIVTAQLQQEGAGAAAPAPAPVDETALRYFARQGDTLRMQAEIDRLRSLHPGWEPPANLLSNDYVPDADIERIWTLVSSGDLAGARAAIAAKQEADPGFAPSEDLLQTLARGEAGLRLRNASDARQYETVITIAANQPDLLTCEAVDNLWRLAEAFVRTGNKPRALDAYSYILTNCTDSAERYATLQKAIELLERDDLDPLFALEQTGADGSPEFADLRLDLARRAIATALENGTKPLDQDVSLFAAAAEERENADDLRLMGWYEMSRDRADAALVWFKRATASDPSPASAQGTGAALLEMGDPEAAEEMLSDYRSEDGEIRALYLDAAAALLALQPRIDLSSNVLGRIVDTVMDTRHAMAAQELGWYAYDFQQPQTAVEWFTLALRWQSDLEPAAYGLMVASNALGDLATVESIRAQWGPRSARIASFGNAANATAPPPPAPRPTGSRRRLGNSTGCNERPGPHQSGIDQRAPGIIRGAELFDLCAGGEPLGGHCPQPRLVPHGPEPPGPGRRPFQPSIAIGLGTDTQRCRLWAIAGLYPPWSRRRGGRGGGGRPHHGWTGARIADRHSVGKGGQRL